ncbi:MAG TPA: resolvase [Deltaproteobacteria bacterium]|jgi:DNA invertase Pin-like site-specific DNA recombinase|nr:resolvase [Deltaproteobacteria bacterium]
MVVGYIRISADQQDEISQRRVIVEYASHNRLRVSRFLEVETPSRGTKIKTKGPGRWVSRLRRGDILIVSELSRLGRSIIEIMSHVDGLVRRGVRLIVIRQSLDLKGPDDVQTKATISVFSLLAELEKDLISARTRRALAAKREEGMTLGRPKGSLGKSKLDPRISEIIDLLKDKASYSFMARRFKVSVPTVINFIKTRNLVELTEKE